MIVDTSAQAANAMISTATLLEAQIVVCSHLGDDFEAGGIS